MTMQIRGTQHEFEPSSWHYHHILFALKSLNTQCIRGLISLPLPFLLSLAGSDFHSSTVPQFRRAFVFSHKTPPLEPRIELLEVNRTIGSVVINEPKTQTAAFNTLCEYDQIQNRSQDRRSNTEIQYTEYTKYTRAFVHLFVC